MLSFACSLVCNLCGLFYSRNRHLHRARPAGLESLVGFSQRSHSWDGFLLSVAELGPVYMVERSCLNLAVCGDFATLCASTAVYVDSAGKGMTPDRRWDVCPGSKAVEGVKIAILWLLLRR